MRMAVKHESHETVIDLVNAQVQSHALLRRGFGASVPFIIIWVFIFAERSEAW